MSDNSNLENPNVTWTWSQNWITAKKQASVSLCMNRQKNKHQILELMNQMMRNRKLLNCERTWKDNRVTWLPSELSLHFLQTSYSHLSLILLRTKTLVSSSPVLRLSHSRTCPINSKVWNILKVSELLSALFKAFPNHQRKKWISFLLHCGTW